MYKIVRQILTTVGLHYLYFRYFRTMLHIELQLLMKQIQSHLEEVLRKWNLISKKQFCEKSHACYLFKYLGKRILATVFPYRGLRALYTSVSGGCSRLLTKTIFQLCMYRTLLKEIFC